MTDIVLNNITSGYNIAKVNDNFQKIEDSINNDLLNLSGGNNTMVQNLDMNSNNLLNVENIDVESIKLNGLTLAPETVVVTDAVLVPDLASTAAGKGASLVGFQQTGTGAASRNVSDKEQERKTLLDYTVSGNSGAININNAIAASNALDVNGPNILVNGTSLGAGALVSNSKRLKSDRMTNLQTTDLNSHVITAGLSNSSNNASNILIDNLWITGNPSNTDNWTPVRIGGALLSRLSNNLIDNSSVGATVSYSGIVPGDTSWPSDRRTTNAVVYGNQLSGSLMGLELFSLSKSSVVGNVAYKIGAQAVNHGYRFTGYGPAFVEGSSTSDMRLRGVASAGNVASNYSNGISQQLGCYHNAHAGYAITDCTNGFFGNQALTYPEAVSRNNVYSSVAVDNCSNGINLYLTGRTVFNAVTISNATLYGIAARVTTDVPSGTYGDGKYNIFSGLITNCGGTTGNPILAEGDNCRYDVTVAESAQKSLFKGNFGIIDIIVGDVTSSTQVAAEIAGSNNIVRIVCNNVPRTVAGILISGSNNHVTVVSDVGAGLGKVEISGNNNKVIGNCLIGTTSAGTGNDVTGVAGYSARGILNGVTTDVNGEIVVTHGMRAGAYAVTASIQTANPQYCVATTKGSTTFTLRVYSGTSVVANTSVSISWIAEAVIT